MAFEEIRAIYGKNAVFELLKSGAAVDTVYIREGGGAPHIEALARERGLPVKFVPDRKLTSLCGTERHQGVAASAGLVEYCSLSDILAVARDAEEDPFIILCDGIEDPHNLGAVIRTAECAGAHGVVIPKQGGCQVTAAVSHAAEGAAEHIAVARVAGIATAVRELKKENVFLYCADMDGDDMYGVNLTGPIGLVVGSEGRGVSRLVREECDGRIRIPMLGKTSSLNASVAAAVAMYEIVRQRRGEKG